MFLFEAKFVIYVLSVAAAFVAGLLFGRKNAKKVEAVVDAAKTVAK